LVRLIGARPDLIDCLAPAKEFQRLVRVRNGILHGKPGTGKPDTPSAGKVRLFQDGNPWTPEMIDEAADEFAACQIVLGSILYGQLATVT
jgi:hypothetical protein